jgi:hypothetical protein
MADEIIGIKVTTDAAQATAEVQKLDKAFEATDDSVKSLRTQLKEATANVAIMADKFGATSKEAINAAKRAAELKDRIGDAKALTDAFNPDAKFKAVAGALSGVAGGFSALQGAMALFGKENKNVEAALLKVNAAMALSQGLNALGDSIDSFTNLGTQIRASTTYMNLNNAATKTAAVIQKAFGIAVAETSVGFKVLKGAIVATGIGALVVLLGSVISNFDAISDWIKKSPLGAFAKSVGSLVEQFTDFVGITSQAKRNIENLTASSKLRNEQIERDIKLLTAQGGQEEEVYKKRTELVNNDLAVLKTKVDASGKLYGEDAKKWKDLNNEKEILTADYNKKSAEETKKANEKAKKDRDDANKQSEEDTKTANKMLIDLQNEKSKALLADENDKALKQLEIDKKAKDAEIEQLKVSQKVKDELIKLNNETYEAEKIELEKKAKEDRDKKQEEEQENLDTFNEKIKDIRIAAIKDDNERAEAERLAKLEKDLKELDEDKEFIKLSQKEQAKIKKDLIDASELEGQNSKNEIVKKGLQEELELLQVQQKSIEEDSQAYWDNLRAIEDKTYKLKLAAAKGNAKEIQKIEAEHSQNNIKIAQAEQDARVKLLTDKFKKIEQFGKDLQVIAGKNKQVAIAGILIEKAAALATIALSTKVAVAKAYAANPVFFGLPWSAFYLASGIAQAIAVINTAKSSIAAINSSGAGLPSGGGSGDGGGGGTPDMGGGTGGGTGGGGALPDTGGGGALPDTGGGGAPNTGGGGGGGSTGGGGGGGTVRAYVVQSDIEDAQQRESEIQNRARFE